MFIQNPNQSSKLFAIQKKKNRNFVKKFLSIDFLLLPYFILALIKVIVVDLMVVVAVMVANMVVVIKVIAVVVVVAMKPVIKQQQHKIPLINYIG